MVRTLCGASSAFVIAAACAQMPSVTVDTTGLGNSEIAAIVKQLWMADPERAIGSKVRELLYRQGDGPDKLRTADFERIGFACPPDQTASCHYQGILRRELHGLPIENASVARAAIAISIIADRTTNPPQIAVHVRETQQ